MSASPPLRLDIVVNIRFPGPRAHGIQVAAMAEALSATGLVVDVVVPRRYPHVEIDPWEHYGVRRTFRVRRIASLDAIDLVSAKWQRIPFLLQSISFGWRALARAAVERDAGLLVRDHYTLRVLVNGLRDRDLLRLASEVHDLPRSDARRRQLVECLDKIPAVVTITHGLRDDLVSAGVASDKILVAPDGVDLAMFDGLPDAGDARAHLNLPRDLRTIVYAGQLFPWKGVDTLVEAVGRLDDVRLLVVGGRPEDLDRVMALATRVAPGRVTFCGQVPRRAVPFHLAAGDVVALPNSGSETISARYTSPLKLFEAMAASRPIVASDLPSLREVLEHDVNAHLVAPDDAQALADGLAAVLDDVDRAERLATAARRDVEAYTWRRRGESVARFLRERLRVGAA